MGKPTRSGFARIFATLLACLAVLVSNIHVANAQGGNDCSTTGGSDTVELPNVSGPSKVLYVIIGNTNHHYQPDMERCGTWVQNAVALWAPNTGSTYQTYYLRGDSNTPPFPDLTPFNQIWVVDLATTPDNAPHQLDAYKAIAAWWEARNQPHIILDGRIISSCWRAVNDQPLNKKLLENYFVNLRIRGGGLVLATDHNSFQTGINIILTNLKMTPFCCYFHEPPYRMYADHLSPILTYPQIAYYNTTGPNYPPYWLWDDSSTGNVAFNQQNNGKIFYPLAWHFTQGVGDPGISSTIRGNVGFIASITSPACHARFEFASASVSFTSSISPTAQGIPPYTYDWTSSLDGRLSTAASFSKSTLSIGAHTVTLRILDSQNIVAEATVSITIFRTPATNETEGPVVSWNGNKDVQIVWPIRRGMSPSAYYNLANGRANTPDSIETIAPRSGNIFFYDDGTNLYVFHIFGHPTADNTQSQTGFSVTFPDIAGFAGNIVFRDPVGSSKYVWNSGAGTGSAQLVWKSGTAGFVAGPLPRNHQFCLNYQFDKNFENNVAYYIVRGQTQGSFLLPNPNPILAFRSAAVETQSVSLCWLQFKCPTTPQVFNAPTGMITNSIVQFSYDGSLYNYTDSSNCYWIATPQIPGGNPILAMWFKSRRFAQQLNDRMVVRNGSLAGSPVVNSYDSATPFPPTTRVRVEGAQSLRFESIPTNDGSVNSGFAVDYYVVPTAVSSLPVSAPYLQSTQVTITGANFYKSIVNGVVMNKHYCKLNGVVILATFVDEDTIICTLPSRPAGPLAGVPLSVSNDGVEYSNVINWAWIDASCRNLTNCGSCLAEISSNCRWCNAGSFCYSDGDPVSCPAPSIDDSCCTQCQTLDGCFSSSGQGSCVCNNTCSCNAGFRNEDCGCKKCPVHPTTNTACGVSSDPEVLSFGECTCNGTCECAYGFNGDSCQCPYCPFSGGEQCSGHGICQCGNCSCDAGWTGDACECSTTCPTSNDQVCSGHGSCICGQCECDDFWRLLDDCSCKESCGILGCSGNGECNCDGTCTCYEGFDGVDCEIPLTCNSTNCEECLNEADGLCGWCTASQKCESKYNRLVCDKPRPQGVNQTLPYATECPIELITTTPPVFDTTAIASGSVVSAAVLGALIVLAAVLLYRRRNTAVDDSNAWFDDPDDDVVVSNPLYEQTGNQGVNPLFEHKEKE